MTLDARNIYICNGYDEEICKDIKCDHAKFHELQMEGEDIDCSHYAFCFDVDEEVKCIKVKVICDFFISIKEMMVD